MLQSGTSHCLPIPSPFIHNFGYGMCFSWKDQIYLWSWRSPSSGSIKVSLCYTFCLSTFTFGIRIVFLDQITSSSASFETILSLLSSFFLPEDDDVLLNWIGIVMGNSKIRTKMRQWRQEWKQLVTSGKDGQALL